MKLQAPLVLCLAALTQAPGYAQPASPPPGSQLAAVNDLRVALEKALELKPSPAIQFDSTKRGGQISALAALKSRFQDEFLMTPIPVSTNSIGIPYQSLSAGENKSLEDLVRGGFIPRSSSLEHLGFVFLRIVELCHDTDPLSSPYLRPPDQ